MSGISLFGRDQMLAAFFVPDTFIAPNSIWVALTIQIPTPGATGNDLIEPEDPAYTRAEYSLGTDFWTTTGRGGITNTAEMVYPELTADYGEVVGWALCDSQYGGNAYLVGELATPQRLYYDMTIARQAVLGAGSIVVKQT